ITNAKKKALRFSAVLDSDFPNDPSCSDDQAFEEKFAAIAKRAFQRDQSDPRLTKDWADAATRLDEGDFYISVILEEAGVLAGRTAVRSWVSILSGLVIPALLVCVFGLALLLQLHYFPSWV